MTDEAPASNEDDVSEMSDREAAKLERAKLIGEAQGLVRSIAMRVHRSLPIPMELDDLIAYGQLGLAEAAQKFDPDSGVRFTTFISAPSEDGDGPMRAMVNALEDAGLSPGDVQYINAHGTSTPAGDAAETLAVKRCFGDLAEKVAVSSTKSMTGHLLGAAGGLETILTIQAIRDGIAPPTINLRNPDPACDLDYVPDQARPMAIKNALSNSFGFGGTNACLVLSKFDQAG